MRHWLMIALILAAAAGRSPAQDSLVLTGVVRDFAELVPKQPGGHPDFNPNEHPGGWEGWGCFDKPEAAKGAVEAALGSNPANPDGLAGLTPIDRDDRGPVLKADYATPPNCFRSRFEEWYTTRNPEVNRAFFLDLAFTKSGNVYTYDNREFFPLDDSKLGALKPQVPGVTTTFGHRQSGTNGGVDLATHNFGFTFELHSSFTYKKGTGQRFAFRGDDDVWVFINDVLVIDLGGLHAEEYADVDLDSRGLEDGKSYTLDFYFAERRYSSSRLTITTSLELRTVDKPDPPKVDPPIVDPPKVDPPKVDPPIVDPPKVDPPIVDPPIVDPPRVDPPKVDPPKVDIPKVEVVLGPVISRALKTVEDTTLSMVPSPVLLITFTEPARVDSPGVLKFKDKAGVEARVDMSKAEPVDAKDGLAATWKFTISPGSPKEPAEGWQVMVERVDLVQNAKGVKTPVVNPWRPIQADLPKIHISSIRAEQGVTAAAVPTDVPVKNPFVILTSDKSYATIRDYVPLHPERAEEWILRGGGGVNPGVVVFNFEISHPAEVEISIYDTQGQFVNETSMVITREDLLHSGRLSRASGSRAFLIRFAWYPIAHDGAFVSTGAYILKSRFTFGIDPRDQVAKGVRDRLVTFGFMRPLGLRGLR